MGLGYSREQKETTPYFQNSILLENTLLPYFCDAEPLKLVNKLFLKLNYEKFNTHIRPHGIVETYYADTTILYERKTCKNGVLNGLTEFWHMNGKLWLTKNYKNGILHGLYESYFPNGQLGQKYKYKNGKEYGLYEAWFNDGEMRVRVTFNEEIISLFSRLLAFFTPTHHFLVDNSRNHTA
jgi:antitoxin component YwqK of YwqJK toxin-antitoxin module